MPDSDIHHLAAEETLLFLGRNTRGSLARVVFADWMEVLNRRCSLECIDLPPNSGAESYRTLVRDIRESSDCVGMQVTSHKLSLFGAARSVFDDLSEEVIALEEVGGVLSRGGRVAAISPDCAAMSAELGSADLARLSGDLVVLGGGGAGRALVWSALGLGQFGNIWIAESSQERIASLSRWALRVSKNLDNVRIRVAASMDAIRIVEEAPALSLVVNATGLGKDAPGSPLPTRTVFPENSVLWDMNYRGNLNFLSNARIQCDKRSLVLRDGFEMFVRNWEHLMSSALGVEISDAAHEEIVGHAVRVRASRG